MANARRLRHQVAARRDLREIWLHTDRVWGRRQAESYLADISNAIQGLASGRTRASRYGERYLRCRVKAHVIFFRQTDIEIVIVRVLHGHMDFDRHLPA